MRAETGNGTAPAAGPPRVSATRTGGPRTSPRRLVADRAATWIVTAGGVAIIASILGILVFILLEVWPLTARASVSPEGSIIQTKPAGSGREAVVCDEYRSLAVTLGLDGVVRTYRIADGTLVGERGILDGSPAPLVRVAGVPGSPLLTASTRDGRVLLVPVRWETTFEEGRRVVTPVIGGALPLQVDPASRPIDVHAARLGDDGTAAAAAATADGTLAVVRREARTNLITGEVSESIARHGIPLRHALTALAMDEEQRNLFGGTSRGEVLWWRLVEGAPEEPRIASAGDSAVTALSLLIGDRSLVVGQADGSLSVWFEVRRPDQSLTLERIRDFPAQPGAIRAISPSMRVKGFLALDESGLLGLYHSTSRRTLWVGESPLRDAGALFFAPKADGALIAGGGRLASIRIVNPHPEASLKAISGKVWYEGYPEADFVWQSSGGTDDFEPKLSLTPLLVGTLKGTIYSLILAVPLAVLSAMYASQFMHPDLRRFVKPAVEIMAAVPSVVLGLLAGLWLAPKVEKAFPSLLLMIVVLPLLILGAGLLWENLSRGLRGRFPVGSETILYLAVLVIGMGICLEGGRTLEAIAFGGSFQAWLLDVAGLPYDQRNAVVVGLAMGFAVIPIIFAIAEDAFSNVPRNLVSGSLALGATRWQTVTRVVLPTASPGIFSAIMVGFGRAVGETMIVLMATGNTPIMEWNPFNGFRTLSANIAVEIPEAPQGGTLYRMLFLAALLLFVFTFAVNTGAELIRQRLRRRYADL